MLSQQRYIPLSQKCSVDPSQYSTVTATIINAYELVPEAYRQKLRMTRIGTQTNVEFAR